MNTWPVLAAALFGALLPACTSPDVSVHQTDGLPPAGVRPRDPWVLRCVLDQQPRMLVIALSDDLWLAYDTQTCTLRKAWRGDVDFDGPVYTTAHGPQPTSRGEDLHDPLAGSTWEFTPLSKTLTRFLGYSFHDGHVTLTWSLEESDALESIIEDDAEPRGPGVATVRETPEVTRDAEGRLVLVRRFEVSASSGDGVVLRRNRWEDTWQAPVTSCTGAASWWFATITDGQGESPMLGYGLHLEDGLGTFRVDYPEAAPASAEAKP